MLVLLFADSKYLIEIVNIPVNKQVLIRVFLKKGIARVKQVNKPSIDLG